MNLTRRDLLERLSWAGGALAIGAPRIVSAAGPDQDWDWLTGSWDVWHRRLKKRLAGNDDWDEFAGKSSFWHLMGGLGNMDENLLYLPAGTYRGMSLRAFDPATRKWAIWWLDLRTAGKLDPPVLGGFVGDEGEFLGKDVFDGKPIDVRIERSSGHRMLDVAARKQVLAKWRFRPAMQDGHRVQAIGLIPVDFHLDR